MTVSVALGKTSIQLEDETRDRLRGLGKKGESYDDIVLRLMNFYEDKKR